MTSASVWVRAWRASPVAFLSYVSTAAAAAVVSVPALPSAAAFVGRPGELVARGGALFLEVLQRDHAGAQAIALVALVTMAVAALGAPWLTMAWLAASRERRSTASALAEGARLYVSSLAVSVVVGALFAATTLATLVAAALLSKLAAPPADARAHDLAFLAFSAPAAVLAVYLACAHDSARARLTSESATFFGSIRHGALDAMRPRTLLTYVLIQGLSLGLLATGLVLAGQLDRGGLVWSAATLVTTQSVVLLRVALRGLWLAFAASRVDA